MDTTNENINPDMENNGVKTEKVIDTTNDKSLDLRLLLSLLLKRKKVFFLVWSITFVLSCIIIIPEPRYYECEVALAPETSGESLAGGLSSVASSFGINLGGTGNDAIYPMLYPDLMASNDFIVSLFDIQVTSEDGEISADYYTYLTKHQKRNVVEQPFIDAKNTIVNMFSSGEKSKPGDYKQIDPFKLSEYDFNLVEKVKSKIFCSVDKKTDVISITVQDQDRLICATMADSVRVRLQDFITKYRTSKAWLDVKHYQALTDSTKYEYEKCMAEYSEYCDSHKDVILQSFISERDQMEQDMQLKYSTYTAMCTQLEAMKAKVQERTPAFTVLKCATVPVKPAGPKRMLFVIGMLVLATTVTSLILLRKNII